MNKDISPELVRSYFHNECTAKEKKEVENWLRSGEDNYQKAILWLKEIESEEDEKFLASLLVAENEVLESAEEIIKKLNDDTSLKGHKKKSGFLKVEKKPDYWYAIAASVLLILFCTWTIKNYYENRFITIETKFAQTKRITLPDSSIIILNGNSSVSYKSSAFEENREVWMKGEVFFDVNHLPNDTKFLVHLSKDKIVEVLGTEFNISERRNLSKVVLKSGRIRLGIPEKNKNIEMVPGELIEVDSNNGSVKKGYVNSELYYSWIYGKWKFDSTTLQELLMRLEETNGIRVNVYDSSLLLRTVSGTIPLHGNSQALIKNIASAFDLMVEDSNDKIYLKERK